MKRVLIMAVALLLCLTGCSGGQGGDEGGVQAVYYLTHTESGRRLGYEVASFESGGELSARIEAVIAAMRNPLNKNDAPLIKENIALIGIQIFGSTVVVRFSEGFDRLSVIESGLMSAGVGLSLMEIEGVRYVRVTGVSGKGNEFMGGQSILLNDEDLRLSAFDIEIYPVSRRDGTLFSHQMRIITEEEELTPLAVLKEMINGVLGVSAPFDGRMDVRTVTAPNESGLVRADIYVPVDMDLRGREADVYSIVNSLYSCRGVNAVTVVINGRNPSDRGLEGCDGPLSFGGEYLGEGNIGQ